MSNNNVLDGRVAIRDGFDLEKETRWGTLKLRVLQAFYPDSLDAELDTLVTHRNDSAWNGSAPPRSPPCSALPRVLSPLFLPRVLPRVLIISIRGGLGRRARGDRHARGDARGRGGKAGGRARGRKGAAEMGRGAPLIRHYGAEHLGTDLVERRTHVPCVACGYGMSNSTCRTCRITKQKTSDMEVSCGKFRKKFYNRSLNDLSLIF